MTLVCLQPCGDRRWRNVAIGLLPEAGSGLFERVADVVIGESGEDHAQRIGLVAERCGAGREGALARGAAP